MSLRPLLSLPALLALAACASQPAPPTVDAPPPPMEAAPAATCNAAAAQGLVGKPASTANVEAARVAAGANTVRSLKPGDAMTMDYRGDRANVMQDAAGTIEKITCG